MNERPRILLLKRLVILLWRYGLRGLRIEGLPLAGSPLEPVRPEQCGGPKKRAAVVGTGGK